MYVLFPDAYFPQPPDIEQAVLGDVSTWNCVTWRPPIRYRMPTGPGSMH